MFDEQAGYPAAIVRQIGDCAVEQRRRRAMPPGLRDRVDAKDSWNLLEQAHIPPADGSPIDRGGVITAPAVLVFAPALARPLTDRRLSGILFLKERLAAAILVLPHRLLCVDNRGGHHWIMRRRDKSFMGHQ